VTRKLQDLYPGQVISGDPNYPHGKPRNVGVLGDGDGTPFEEKWLTDYQGFVQALLVAAGIEPNGAAETVSDSQYLAAIRYLTKNITGNVSISGDLNVTGEAFYHDEVAFAGTAIFQALLRAAANAEFNGTATFNGSVQTHLPIVMGPNSGVILGRRGALFNAGGTLLGTGGDVDVQIPVAIREAVRLATGGRLVHKVQTAPNADATIALTNGDRLVIPNTVSGGRVYNLSEATADGAEVGAELRIINWSLFAHTIQSAGTPVLILPADGGSALPNTWRPSKVDMLYHNNGAVSRWLPGPVTIG
jgi:hypothetical protein